MVILIESLHSKKGYQEETLFLAVSLADKFLKQLTAEGAQFPYLVNLAFTCLIVAAKLNQFLRPKFSLMNELL